MTSASETTKPSSKRAMTGFVRSISGDKSISVTVTTLVKHPRYGKYVRQRTKVAAHCPNNDVNVGDLVEIVSCRRLSNTKSWRLSKIVRRSKVG